jgi:hypothetical protein
MTSETEADVWSVRTPLSWDSLHVVSYLWHWVRCYPVQAGECPRSDKNTIVRNVHGCIATVLR